MTIAKDWTLTVREKKKLIKQLRDLILNNDVWSLQIDADVERVPDDTGMYWTHRYTGVKHISFTVG